MTDDLKSAVEIIKSFINSCEDISTGIIRTEDGVKLYTDWGYFEDGLNEIERYLKLKEEKK